MVESKALFQEEHSIAYHYIQSFQYPWEALKGIKALILELGPTLDKDQYEEIQEHVWVHKTAKVFPSAYLGEPCIIGARTEVRHCAFVRSAAIVGEDCVIGNSVELKNVIISDGAQVPHYNYVGDSILGYKSHMGAGSITSNIKSDKTNIIIRDRKSGEEYVTGLRKIGAFLGDYVEVGCNSVLNPGTVIGIRSNVYPLSSVRGVVPACSIWKNIDNIIAKEER